MSEVKFPIQEKIDKDSTVFVIARDKDSFEIYSNGVGFPLDRKQLEKLEEITGKILKESQPVKEKPVKASEKPAAEIKTEERTKTQAKDKTPEKSRVLVSGIRPEKPAEPAKKTQQNKK